MKASYYRRVQDAPRISLKSQLQKWVRELKTNCASTASHHTLQYEHEKNGDESCFALTIVDPLSESRTLEVTSIPSTHVASYSQPKSLVAIHEAPTLVSKSSRKKRNRRRKCPVKEIVICFVDISLVSEQDLSDLDEDSSYGSEDSTMTEVIEIRPFDISMVHEQDLSDLDNDSTYGSEIQGALLDVLASLPVTSHERLPFSSPREEDSALFLPEWSGEKIKHSVEVGCDESGYFNALSSARLSASKRDTSATNKRRSRRREALGNMSGEKTRGDFVTSRGHTKRPNSLPLERRRVEPIPYGKTREGDPRQSRRSPYRPSSASILRSAESEMHLSSSAGLMTDSKSSEHHPDLYYMDEPEKKSAPSKYGKVGGSSSPCDVFLGERQLSNATSDTFCSSSADNTISDTENLDCMQIMPHEPFEDETSTGAVANDDLSNTIFRCNWRVDLERDFYVLVRTVDDGEICPPVPTHY